MKTLQKYTLITVLLAMTVACKKDKESIDTEKPTIAIDSETAFPKQCTEIGECTVEAIKTPIKPFTLVKTVNIPGQPQQYDAELKIDVPADIDPGNYHFMIQVTDLAGWSSQKGISIRILE